MVTWVVLVATSWADPEPDPADSDPTDAVDEEVIIYGELRVARARAKLEREIEDRGYTREIRREGRTVYRNEVPWLGQVVVYDDGWVDHQRSPLRFQPPGLDDGDGKPTDWLACALIATCIRTGSLVVSKRKLAWEKQRTFARIHDDASEWAARIADLSTDRKVEDLPTRLGALWYEGRPLDGDDYLPEVADRKAALLSYWESRTDTVWGEEVRQAVESFIRGEVQYSEHPYTEEEVAAFNARTTAPRPLALFGQP